MFKTLSISAARGPYIIEIGKSVSEIPHVDGDIWLVDANLREQVPNFEKSIYLHASEDSKSLETCIQVLGQMKALGANKNSKLIAVGGGVVQDIATLSASLYMRGISWTYAPTTKMAQLDSCVGGKSSINLSGIKNLVGNIYPPSQVVIDFQFDDSLSKQALVSGYLEAIKISFARGEIFFNSHLKITSGYSKLEAIPQEDLCLQVLGHKKHFIELDENDTGIRQLLNFGHTFGHALESASNFGFQHGIAVGLGMLMALNYPLSSQDPISEELKLTIFTLLRHVGFDSIKALSGISAGDFYQAFVQDKKHSRLNHNLVLYREQGLSKVSIPVSKDHEDAVIKAFEAVRGSLLNELR